MDRIWVELTNYANSKGKHTFTMTVKKLKAFSPFFSVNEYAGILWQEMYWEKQEDCHNLVVSAIITKTEFLECNNNIYTWLIIMLSIVQINLRKCDHYLLLSTNNAF